MVLGDVEETITSREIDEETYEELIKVIFFSISTSIFYFFEILNK